LIDCEEATMIKRLVEDRKQPELANQDMKNWLKYLRRQAQELGIPIINTSKSNLDESVKILLEIIKNEH